MENQNTEQLYNLNRLTKLASNNIAFVKKMALLFLKQSPSDLIELKETVAAKNIHKMKEVAHRMKPSVDNMNITSLFQTIRDIELFEGTELTEEILQHILFVETILSTVFLQLEQDPLIKD